MTQITQGLIQVALVTLIWVNLIAGVLLLHKLFSGRLGFRFRDRVWSNLDDHGERLAVVEMTLEQLRPKTQTGDLGPATERNIYSQSHYLNEGAVRTDEIRRVLGILGEYEARIGDSRLFKEMTDHIKRID